MLDHTRAARDLSPAQLAAARKYARAFERARSDILQDRLEGADALRHAAIVLSVPERAVMDMLAGRGVKLSDLAAKVGRKPRDLWMLYIFATLKLARHFEDASGHG